MGGPNSASNQGRWTGTDMWGLLADGKQRVSRLESYPISRIEELLALVAGGTVTKLDLKHAHQQLVLDEEPF